MWDRTWSADLSGASCTLDMGSLATTPRSALNFEDPDVIPNLGWDSIPTGSRSDPERTTDKFGIKSGSRELSPLEVGIKKIFRRLHLCVALAPHNGSRCPDPNY